MGRKFNFSIPGRPFGWQRVIPFKGGKPYLSRETRIYKQQVRDLFAIKFPRETPITGPVMVRITAVFAIPKGFTAAQRAAALAGQLYVTKKPDKDNIEKAIYDALNGLAWQDDAQVSGGCIKRYGEPERVDVTIEELHNTVETPVDKRRKTSAAELKLPFR